MNSRIKSLLLGVVGAVMILAFQNFSFIDNRFYKFVPIQGEDWPEPGDTDDTSGDDGDGSDGGRDAAFNPTPDTAGSLPNLRTTESGGIDPSSFKDMISFGQ